MDFNKIKEAAQAYQTDMTAFLRAIVKNPGESCDEKAHIDTIAAEMKKLDFDEVIIDPQGNVIGYMGTGDKIIAYDAHIDTVGIGNIDNWNFDPYEGYENDTEIGGRGVSDQCGGIVSAVRKAVRSWSLEPFRKRTATACAGSTLSMKTRSVRNSSYPQSLQTAASTADSADAWRSAWM